MLRRRQKRHIITDITYGRYSRVIDLKLPKKRRRIMILASSIVLVTFIVTSIFVGHVSKASIVELYPSVCLGNWQNIDAATGEPHTILGDSFDDFDVTNSAWYSMQDREIFCGGFSNDLIETDVIKNAKVRLHWSIASRNDVASEDIFMLPVEEVEVKSDELNLLQDKKDAVLVDTSEELLEDDIEILGSTSTEAIVDETDNIPDTQFVDIEAMADEDFVSEELVGESEIQVEIPDDNKIITPVSEAENNNPITEESTEIQEEVIPVSEVDPISFLQLKLKSLITTVFAQEVDGNLLESEIPEDAGQVIDVVSNEELVETQDFVADEVTELPIEEVVETEQLDQEKQVILELESEENIEEGEIIIDTADNTKVLDDEVIFETSTVLENIDNNTTTEKIIESLFIEPFPETSSIDEDIDSLFEIKYSFDGTTWNTVGLVSFDDWQSEFELPVDSLEDISTLQISIESREKAKDYVVLLDAIVLEVEYVNDEIKADTEGEEVGIIFDSDIKTDESIISLDGEKGLATLSFLDRRASIELDVLNNKPESAREVDFNTIEYSDIRNIGYSIYTSSIDIEAKVDIGDDSLITIPFSLSNKNGLYSFYEENSSFLVITDVNSGEDLFSIGPINAQDASGNNIPYRVGIDNDIIRLEPYKALDKLNINYPIQINLPIGLRLYDEMLVKVGDDNQEMATAKDGDVVNIRPAGWIWGGQESRDFVVVRVPKMTQKQREYFTQRYDDPIRAGAIKYGFDYVNNVSIRERKKIRNYDKVNDYIDLRDEDINNILQIKTLPAVSTIPYDKRLTKNVRDNFSFFTRVVKGVNKIIRPALAQTINTYTIGSGTCGGSACDYSTIQAWEDARNGDLVTANTIEKGEVYNNATFTAGVTIDGSTTDSTHYMWLTVASADRHTGTAGTGARIDANSLTAVIDNVDEYTIVEWLEIYDSTPTATQNSYGVRGKDGYGTYRNMIIHDVGDGAGGTDVTGGFSSWTGHDLETENIYNNFIYNINGQGIQLVGSAKVYNNTVYNNDAYGVMSYSSYCGNSSIVCDIQNNISMNNNQGTGGATDFETADLGANDFMNNNMSADATADDCTACSQNINNLVSKTTANQFVSTVTPDLHLTTGSDAINTATSTVESLFTDDIDVDSRNNRKWDIGADEWGTLSNTTYTDPTSNGTGSNFTSPTNAFTSNNAYAIGLDTYVIDVDNFGFSLPTGSVLDGIQVRVEWHVSSGTFNLSCQLLDATGLPVGDTEKTADNSSTTDITSTLGSVRSTWNTTLAKADIEDVDFGVRCTATKVSGILTAQVNVDNIDIDVTYTEPPGGGSTNATPTITSVTTSPNSVAIGSDISFSVDWNDTDVGEMIKVKICKTNSLTSQNCDGGYWASSTTFTTTDPEVPTYTAQTADVGSNDYYAFVCDDEGACSASTSGSFIVSGSWWDTNFGYRKEINVYYASTSVLTQYQLMVDNLDTAALVTASKMRSDCGDIRFTSTSTSVTLPYTIVGNSCNTADTEIWIQTDLLLSSATTTFYMYYGNSATTTTDSIVDTFSYNTEKIVGYQLNDNDTSMDAITLEPNNSITMSGTTYTLTNEGDTATVNTTNAYDPIYAKKLFNMSSTSYDVPVPVGWAGTEFMYQNRSSSYNNHFVLVSPWGTATVTVTAAGVATASSPLTVTSSGYLESSIPDTNGTLKFTSDIPIIINKSSDNADPYPMHPATTDPWYGWDSTTVELGVGTDGTNVTWIDSNDTSSTSDNSNSTTTVNTIQASGASYYSGETIKVMPQNYTVGVSTTADSDGGDATTFAPRYEFGTKFGSAYNNDFVSVVSDQLANCTTTDFVTLAESSATLESANSEVYGLPNTTFGTGNSNASLSNRWKLECDKPVWAVSQVTADEQNMWSYPMMRQFTYPTPYISTYGSEETAPAGGSLSTDIVDNGGLPVTSPSVSMAGTSVGQTCDTSTGTFGASTEKIRVENTTASATWTLTMAATATTEKWTTGSVTYDFNDSTSSGCSDGADSDSIAGQLTVDASVGTVTPQSGCSLTGITKGSSASFSEGSIDSITLLTAGGTADTSCYWDLTGTDISQTIPAEQSAGSYNIDLVLTITAS